MAQAVAALAGVSIGTRGDRDALHRDALRVGDDLFVVFGGERIAQSGRDKRGRPLHFKQIGKKAGNTVEWISLKPGWRTYSRVDLATVRVVGPLDPDDPDGKVLAHSYRRVGDSGDDLYRLRPVEAH
jgi:hypothetical protein